MKLILLEDVKDVGKKNDVVEVNDGYGRNFLLRKKLAREVTAANLNDVKMKKGAEAELARRELENAKLLASKIENKEFELKVKCGEGGKLYGAVTSMDVAEAVKKAGYEVSKKNIVIDGTIKNVGKFDVKVKLHSKVSTKIVVSIVAE